MVEKTHIAEPEPVACEICLTEVPQSVAGSPEGVDYVYHFCGPECYSMWTATPAGRNVTAARRPR